MERDAIASEIPEELLNRFDRFQAQLGASRGFDDWLPPAAVGEAFQAEIVAFDIRPKEDAKTGETYGLYSFTYKYIDPESKYNGRTFKPRPFDDKMSADGEISFGWGRFKTCVEILTGKEYDTETLAREVVIDARLAANAHTPVMMKKTSRTAKDGEVYIDCVVTDSLLLSEDPTETYGGPEEQTEYAEAGEENLVYDEAFESA